MRQDLRRAVVAWAVAAAVAGGGRAWADGGLAAQGQALIEAGKYQQAVGVFTQVIQADPTGADGYRGRIEAYLLLGRYSDALRDNARITAYVEPPDPDVRAAIQAGYAARLAADPNSVTALTGASFFAWAGFDYPTALDLLDRLLAVRPANRYGLLFRGSTRLLSQTDVPAGEADLDRAVRRDPLNPHVRFVVADAYTYGEDDPVRAYVEGWLALLGGLDTPRVHAILAVANQSFGQELAAALHVRRHFELVTTQTVPAAPLAPGGALALPLVPGRTYEVPLPVTAGQAVSVWTDSPDFYDTILLLVGPNGVPVLASDDAANYFAGFDWVAPTAGTYRLYVTSFEGINTGQLLVTRD